MVSGESGFHPVTGLACGVPQYPTSHTHARVLWYDRPAREFPARRWARAQYGFVLPPLRLRSGGLPIWREFPAWRWMRLRAAGVV